MLPGSTEVSSKQSTQLSSIRAEILSPVLSKRILSVAGVADAVHIAVYYIGTILVEYQDRNPSGPGGAGASTGQYRQGGGGGGSSSAGYGSGGGGTRHVGSGGGVGGGAGMMLPAPGQDVQQFWIPNELVGSSE